MSEAAEEFEAVWAVVRRLEARIRRLEASVSALETELSSMRAEGAEGQPPEIDAAEAAGDAIASGQAESPHSEPWEQADDATPPSAGAYRLVFDGGSLGNPGRGYGSYHLTSPRGGAIHERLDFADRGTEVTNNQAEYLTLIRALERLHEALGERARSATVEIRGDSQLVVNQLTGRWKVRNAELQPLHERARSLLNGFGQVDLQWHARARSVEVLGH